MFEQAFKNIDDALRKEAGCATELDYAEQTSWLLFLKYLDGLEADKTTEAALEGKKYTPILEESCRWERWAAPKDAAGKLDHNRALTGDDLRDFVNQRLFPYLHKFKERATGPNTIEYKIGEIFGELKNKITSGYNLREVIDHVDELRFRSQTEKHELSALYEEKIKRMGNAGRNGGEYYTPRPLIRAIIRVVGPRLGETIYDGACGSGGFLCEAFDYLRQANPARTTAQDKALPGKNLLRQGEEITRLRHRHHESHPPRDRGAEHPPHEHAHRKPRRHSGKRPLRHRARESALRRQRAPRGAAEFSHPHRRDGVPLSPALYQNPQARRARRHHHQEHVFVEHRQRLREPAQAVARKLQSAHRARLPRRHLPGRGREDGGAIFRERRAHAAGVVLPARPRPQSRQDEPAQRRRPRRIRRVAKGLRRLVEIVERGCREHRPRDLRSEREKPEPRRGGHAPRAARNPRRNRRARCRECGGVGWHSQAAMKGDGRNRKNASDGKHDSHSSHDAHPVPIAPGGTLSDYIPFYFTPFSMMMYNIHTGRGVKRRENREIVIFVSSLYRLRKLGVPFVFTNQHAYAAGTNFHSDVEDLGVIDWDLLRSRNFKTDDADPGKGLRYQAEALVHRHLPLAALLAICCNDATVKQRLDALLAERGQRVDVKVLSGWYF